MPRIKNQLEYDATPHPCTLHFNTTSVLMSDYIFYTIRNYFIGIPNPTHTLLGTTLWRYVPAFHIFKRLTILQNLQSS